MTLFIVAISITAIAAYFLHTSSDEGKTQSFKDDCLVGVLIMGFIMILMVMTTGVLNYYDVPEKNQAIFLVIFPIFMLALLAIWATWGDSKSDGGADDKKDDFTSEAIVLTTVLSEDDTSKDSNHSNSSGSSSSSSSSNSDDFFIL